jgi:hypothetical protein
MALESSWPRSEPPPYGGVDSNTGLLGGAGSVHPPVTGQWPPSKLRGSLLSPAASLCATHQRSNVSVARDPGI